MHHPQPHARTVAILGPYGTGKSTLFEAMLAAAGHPLKRGVERGGTDLHMAHCLFMHEPWTLLDCPGGLEYGHAAQAALAVADMAVLVCDADETRAATAAPLLHALDASAMPFVVFLNRIDGLAGRAGDTVAALQAHTRRPLVLRQVPILESGIVTGYVDVVSERAYRYRKGAPSFVIGIPSDMRAPEKEAKAGLMEALAEHDDTLLEQLIEDIVPSTAEIYERLHHDQAESLVAGVLLGAADRAWGIHRLWKALRHDAPTAEETAARHGVAAAGGALVQVFRTLNAGHAGRLSWARVWRGPLKDGAVLDGHRVGGIWKMPAGEAAKAAEAATGDIVALGRLEAVATGAVLGDAAGARLPCPAPPPAVFAVAITTTDHKDDVRLSTALKKLAEEDPALHVQMDPDTGETVLAGQGEMHLRGVVERIAAAYAVKVTAQTPKVAFRESIRQKVQQHARLKRQTGGHGQFADVTLEIAPRERGAGYKFVDKIVGGAVPRNYIPAVGEAAEEALHKGVYGHPVVDVEVTLTDGGFHAVDSSDMAFRTATRMAIAEALPLAGPMLLEPIEHVSVSVPAAHTAAAQRLLTGRRGQILGFGDRDGWPGWNDVQALVPQAELQDMILELRSLTQGLGTFTHRFAHLAEAHGAAAQMAVAGGRR